MSCLDTAKSQAFKSTSTRDFRKLLLEAVDEGLSWLGDSPKQAIYSYLDRTYAIKKQDIPDKIEEFTDAIEEVFGQGAKILQIQIMKHLYDKVGHNFQFLPEEDNLVFTEYVQAARAHTHRFPSSCVHAEHSCISF